MATTITAEEQKQAAEQPKLAPKPEDVGEAKDPFLLHKPELRLVQIYVEAGTKLPKTIEELSTRTGISEQNAQQFGDIVAVYKDVNDHCINFQSKIYPKSVELAGHITSYNSDVQTYYPELTKFTDDWKKAEEEGNTKQQKEIEKDFKLVAEELIKQTNKYAQKAQETYTEIKKFVEQTEQDKNHLDPLDKKYRDKFTSEQGELNKTREQIDKLKKDLEQKNKDYEYHEWKAKTETAYYGWLGPIGASVAIGMYVKHSGLAKEIQEQIKGINEQIKQAKEKEKTALLFVNDLNMASDSLKDIVQKLNDALPILQRIQALWQKISQELQELLDSVKQRWDPEKLRLLPIHLKNAMSRWADIAKKANIFYSVAYVKVVDEKDIDKTLEEIIHKRQQQPV